MKISVCLLFMAGSVSMAIAQDLPQAQVPSLVLNTFQTKFSNATDVEWELKGDLYKCEFNVGRFDHDLWIDKSGKITKHKEEISKNDLPEAITKKLHHDFKGYTVDDVDRIETNGKVLFQIDLDGSPNDREVLLASDGTIVQEFN